ncbi:Outer membrane protein OprM [Pandoraea terrae]|uniref:Outer membrane protein OprM n=1 Tax=Pandoraea terrae TaxID=1537710 RepID=A0A5E4WGN5_9BURK|nr:efflux transporter outer membrane subunit [Pandoraea terrae]VVE23992.1 Outer membrane protein OprM [Pandoraea terrae]
MDSLRRWARCLAIGFTALPALSALVSCAVGPDFHTPAAPSVAQYTAGTQPPGTAAADSPQGAAQRFDAGAMVPVDWWTRFGSPGLDRLVADALAASPTLVAAVAKLRQAQEDYAARAGGTRWPSADLNLSAKRQQVDLASFGITSVPNPGPFSLYNASVDVSYTLDIFGANRRTLEGLAAQTDYARFQWEAARLALAANVVTAAIRRASLRAQLSAAEGALAAQTQQLSITQERLSAGGVAQLDVENQQSLVAQTAATLPALRQQIAQLDHQLALYLGQPPGTFASPELTLHSLQLPEDLPLVLPSALARRRPDVRASEALLHRASADVGVATANLYPRFTLTGSFGSQRTRAADLADSVNVWNIGMSLLQPIFRGGQLRAERRSAVAAYDAALANYQQTVLQGFVQVADALRTLESDAQTLQARSEAATRADRAWRISEARYRAGGISQLALLDAQRQALDTARAQREAQGARLADTAALFQALGGGWQETDHPAASAPASSTRHSTSDATGARFNAD